MKQNKGLPVQQLYNFFYTQIQILWIFDRDKDAEVFSYPSLFGLPASSLKLIYVMSSLLVMVMTSSTVTVISRTLKVEI